MYGGAEAAVVGGRSVVVAEKRDGCAVLAEDRHVVAAAVAAVSVAPGVAAVDGTQDQLAHSLQGGDVDLLAIWKKKKA